MKGKSISSGLYPKRNSNIILFLMVRHHWRIQGAPPAPPPPPPPQQDPFLSFLHTFLPKSVRIGGWRPPTGWRPPPTGILDPPLDMKTAEEEFNLQGTQFLLIRRQYAALFCSMK